MLIENLKDNQGEIIEGPKVISPLIFDDVRGFFYESWNLKLFKEKVNSEINFVQENTSSSKKGVLRGLHYQLPPFSQGKLVKVSSGSIFDVIVDLRLKSKTFLNWAFIELNDINKKQLWVPSGFAHGFLSLKDKTIVDYKVTNFWSRDHERSILWSDKSLNIDWPKGFNLIISSKDSMASSLEDLSFNKELFI